ncbi:hypothetical protein EON80_00175 [bacterium]|nr:MAG: hypothetical protein EON80_00175 [bacterium]
MASRPERKWRWALLALAVGGGALFLVALECLASLVRAHFLPDTPFFHLPDLWVSFSIAKGLVFGPILGLLTMQVALCWRKQNWDEACYYCLRGGSALCGTQILFVVCCLLGRSYFPRLTWMVDTWPNFALWLTLNGALLWALLLLIAGFLLPSDARKTVQVSESLRF